MKDIDVIDVQRALARSAKSGLDLTKNPHTAVVIGREYPTSFKSLDVNPEINYWYAQANIPQENATIQKITTSAAQMNFSPPHLLGYALIPHLEHEDDNYKLSRFTDSGYVSSDMAKAYPGRSLIQFDASGKLYRNHQFLDKEGNYITDVHGWLKHHGSQPTTGMISTLFTGPRGTSEPSGTRKMSPAELRIHKELTAPPKGMVGDPFWPGRTAPHGSVHVRLHDEVGEDLARYAYNPITESLTRLS